MVIDMGAFEFGIVHLEVTGEPTAGGTLRLDLTGKPGLVVLLFAGTDPAEELLHPYGPRFFGGDLLFTVFTVVPDQRIAQLDPLMTVPQSLVLQALGFGLFSRNGNFSNSVELHVE
jgi:hypothetical protein